jgi:hypothetical protein
MNQREFEFSGAGSSQCECILNRLRAEPGQWIPMPTLWKCSGAFAVHSRIADLRKRGHHIEHRNDRAEDGTILSSYRLVIAEAVAA